MSKVSIGLRGWRFEEREVFTEEGEFRPLTEIPKETRHRLVRLSLIVERPCDACYLVHGESEKDRCRQATIVYGEPLDEVLLCDAHEADFLYWFREGGGRGLAGDEEFRDAFHEWFAAGGRAPEGYAGLEHVETDPDTLPDPPDAQEVQRRLEETNEFEGEQIDLREGTPFDRPAKLDGESEETDDEDGDEAADTDADADDADLDLGADYPTR
ncbi:hypothetical protein C2R22_11195 [Salinigranum rubrum]|uniref:Uncharacterized protein n=1 Tax=Salinigranum rubrum TaxID=755307 RepID=A0A2I8VJN6_9EURY|nr:hypothetical protein [Salinigranum rubrum]AUV82142.1 hypothetical protein C2R22_11195 [Salinigranum rubrum]